MDINEITDYIERTSDNERGMGILLSQIIVSVYSGGQVDLKRVHNFDETGFKSMQQVLAYRRTPGWSDETFYGLFQFASGVLDARLVAATPQQQESWL